MIDKNSGFGLKIKQIRENKHFTVRQAALQAGISSSYWSQVENGKRNTPKPATLAKIAKGLSTDKNTIFRLAGLTVNLADINEFETVDLKEQIEDKNKIMTYQGRPIPEEDLKYIKRLLDGSKDDDD